MRKFKCIVWWILCMKPMNVPITPKVSPEITGKHFPEGSNAFITLSQRGEESKPQLKTGLLGTHSFIQHIVKIRTQLTIMATTWEVNVPDTMPGTFCVLSLTHTKILKCKYIMSVLQIRELRLRTKWLAQCHILCRYLQKRVFGRRSATVNLCFSL